MIKNLRVRLEINYFHLRKILRMKSKIKKSLKNTLQQQNLDSNYISLIPISITEVYPLTNSCKMQLIANWMAQIKED